MKAAIVAVGSELLGTERLDTNSLRLTETLERFGVGLAGKAVVGDEEGHIERELLRWLALTDLVLVTGGLGPTADDLTRPAVARALGRGLSIDEDRVEALRRFFASFGREMAAVNRRQAEVIEGAEILENRRGTAPGMRLENGKGAHLFLFPGVPRELEAMIEDHLRPWLAGRCGEAQVERRILRVASRPESEVEQRLGPVYELFPREDISVLASVGDIQIQLHAHGDAGARRQRLEAMVAAVHQCLGPRAVYGEGLETTLEVAVAQLLGRAGATVGTAESCTGGLVAERLTAVPGSSAYFLGALVCYSNGLKTALAKVPAEVLEEHGAVSEAVARALAGGARRVLGSDYGIGITGIAGPGGGSEEKPVGTVHLAVAGPSQEAHRQVRLPGGRQRVRHLTNQLALEMLRYQLLAVLGEGREG